jgi:hypothetical protein
MFSPGERFEKAVSLQPSAFSHQPSAFSKTVSK